MKNLSLANWLEQSIDRIASAGGPMGPVIVEGVLQFAGSGSPEMLISVLGSAARNAAADNEPIHDLLGRLHAIKTVIFERLEEEIEPAQAWVMLLSLEQIFNLALSVTVSNYITALNESHQAKLAESAKVHQVTEQQVLEYAASVARANRELAKLEQAKTDFISIAAHELKTPLSVVMGYVKMLDEEREAILEREADTVFRGIIHGSERLETIINNMLDISALETNTLLLKQEPVTVGSVVKAVVEQSKADADSRHHRFKVQIAPKLPTITSDAQRLHQVLHQLVNNAIKYTPDGGQIKIGVFIDPGDEDQRQIAEGIKIEVCDSGIGIAPEDQEQIFDKFYRVGESSLHSSGRVKFKGAGPGLGLSIARGVIKSLNGQIWVESPGYDEVNCPGSIFHIRLPL